MSNTSVEPGLEAWQTERRDHLVEAISKTQEATMGGLDTPDSILRLLERLAHQERMRKFAAMTEIEDKTLFDNCSRLNLFALTLILHRLGQIQRTPVASTPRSALVNGDLGGSRSAS